MVDQPAIKAGDCAQLGYRLHPVAMAENTDKRCPGQKHPRRFGAMGALRRHGC